MEFSNFEMPLSPLWIPQQGTEGDHVGSIEAGSAAPGPMKDSHGDALVPRIDGGDDVMDRVVAGSISSAAPEPYVPVYGLNFHDLFGEEGHTGYAPMPELPPMSEPDNADPMSALCATSTGLRDSADPLFGAFNSGDAATSTTTTTLSASLGLGGIAVNPSRKPASKKKGVGKEPRNYATRKKGGDAELQQLFALVDKYGNHWTTIVEEIEGFTLGQVRHHGRKYLDEKKERKENLLKVSGMCLQTL